MRLVKCAVIPAAMLVLALSGPASACSDEAWDVGFDGGEMTMEDLERLQRATAKQPVG